MWSTFSTLWLYHVAAAQNSEWLDVDGVSFPCTIDVKDASDFSLSEFHANYALKKPLLIRGAAKGWPAQKLWTKSFMKERFGDNTVAPEPDAYMPTSGEGMSFNAFLESMNSKARISEYSSPHWSAESKLSNVMKTGRRNSSLYIFQSWEDIMTRGDFDAAIHRLPYLTGRLDEYLMIGSNGTGLFWHAHDSALNACVHGRRRWFLFPGGTKGSESEENKEMREDIQLQQEAGMRVWAESFYPALPEKHRRRVLECVQAKGDVIYVPEGVEHGVVNYGDTVAVSFNQQVDADGEAVEATDAWDL
jgi:hypothetical protein